ncbi:MAG TPA: hypothetical protein VET84_04895 [Stellaceae bacterium]|jgi:hypothetical protein|nr:hypothetical protein [Stellaceae bacterium]
MNEHDDPEASYRRGYQQGAAAMLEAVGRLAVDKLKHWAFVSLAQWRYFDRPRDRSVPPPPAN